MYRIIMDILCVDGYSEALPGDGENAELIIESLVAPILLDLFRLVIVNRIKIICLPVAPTQQSLCLLQIHIVSPTEATTVQSEQLEALELKLEDAICSVLIELFSHIIVNKVAVEFAYDPALDFAPIQAALDAIH